MHKRGYVAGIWSAGRSAWAAALLEISIVAGISLIPLIGGALRELFPINTSLGLEEAAKKAFLSGQLIFYSIGLIATIVANANRDFRSFQAWRAIFNMYCIFGIVICALLIGYDPTLASVNPTFLAWSSVILFSSAIVFYTIFAVILNIHANVGDSLAEDDKRLMDQLAASRGIKK